VDRERDRAIRNAKALITQYLAQQPHIAKASGVRRETVEAIQSMLGWPATKAQVLKAMDLVPDELVLRITATGAPDDARSKVDEYMQRGCTCPVLYPLGDPYLMMDTFSDL
jgi:5,10-methylenetetrahydromethanopterin reductase